MSNNTITPLLNAGTIRPLDDLVARYGQIPAPNPLIQVDGKTMAVAMMVNTHHLIYREDRLADLGLELSTTWNEVFAAADAIKARSPCRTSGPAGAARWMMPPKARWWARSRSP